jgi:hypothetical protein
MLTLAGYPLLGDNDYHELESMIVKYINPQSYQPWLRRSFPGFGLTGLTRPLGFDGEPVFKLNTFHWPSSASRWAYGHFLCDSGTLAKIMNLAYSSQNNGSYNPIPLAIGNAETNQNQGSTIGINPTGNPTGETLTTNVFLLPPTPLSGKRTNGPNYSLYLITVVDARFFWFWVPFASGNNPIVITLSTTWGDLFDYIAAALNITIYTDVINPYYLQPSISMFSLPFEPMPLVLDAVSTNVGQRISVNFDGTVNSSLYDTDLKVFNDDMAAHPSRLVLAGGQRFSSPL